MLETTSNPDILVGHVAGTWSKVECRTLAWLRDNKVTQNELAEILGMTPQQLNDIVKDRTVRGDFHPVLGTWAMVLLAVLLGILLWNAPTRCRRL